MTFFRISSLFSLGNILSYAVQMLKSGLILTRVTLTITPCIWRVCSWKIVASSFCNSLDMRFCLVSCIIIRIDLCCKDTYFSAHRAAIHKIFTYEARNIMVLKALRIAVRQLPILVECSYTPHYPMSHDAWFYLSCRMLQRCNAVSVASLFKWVNFAI